LPASVELENAKVLPIGDNVHISGFPKWKKPDVPAA
jgi:hypothetical protein